MVWIRLHRTDNPRGASLQLWGSQIVVARHPLQDRSNSGGDSATSAFSPQHAPHSLRLRYWPFRQANHYEARALIWDRQSIGRSSAGCEAGWSEVPCAADWGRATSKQYPSCCRKLCSHPKTLSAWGACANRNDVDKRRNSPTRRVCKLQSGL